MLQVLKNKWLLVWGGLLYAIILFYLSYFTTRLDEYQLLICFSFLFILYGVFLYSEKWSGFKKNNVSVLIGAAIAFRLLLFFSVPNLSDDYFRFAWDGNLLVHSHNPYAYKPKEFLHLEGIQNREYLRTELYNGSSTLFPDGMNSKKYYSVYPPFNQAVFALAYYLSGDNLYYNILFLRLFLLLFEAGTIALIYLLLQRFKIPLSNLFIYAFNPLVIVEVIQNLHFEGVTVFWVLLSIFLLSKKRIVLSGIAYALGIATKLIPLLLLPLFLFRVQWKRLVIFYSVIITVLIFSFLPFSSVDLFQTFGESIRLYFKSFEFNASLYYIFREIGFWIKGYNTIQIIGSISPFFVLSFVLILTVKTRNNRQLPELFLLFTVVLFFYYLLASIVHPWYVIYLVAFASLTRLTFPLAWSFTVVFSYYAYRNTGGVQEEPLLLLLEYGVVFLTIYYDWKSNNFLPYGNQKS